MPEAALTVKLLKWLKNEFKGRGGKSKLARAIGATLPQGGKILRKPDGAAYDPPLSTIEALARAKDFSEVWAFLREVEGERVERRRPALEFIDEVHRQRWTELFKGDPDRAERVLMNLRHQEALGYTELISEIVHRIIDGGATDSVALKVADLIRHHAQTAETVSPSRTKLRRKLSAEYGEIRQSSVSVP